jgi:hypothetical protein
MDFDKVQKDSKKKAKKMIKEATGFMLTDQVVKENPYLKNKMEIDVMSLSGMIYQMDVNREMQKALMEEVRHGAVHPRNFEVFSQLTKTINEINKQMLQTVEAIKQTYKDLNYDIEERQQRLKALGEGEQGKLVENENGIVALGSKELIKKTKALKAQKRKEQDDDISDVEIEE